MTTVLAVTRPRVHRTPEENLGVGYLAAVLRLAGRSVRIIDAWLDNLSVSELCDAVVQIPELAWVGLSCHTIHLAEVRELVGALRTHLAMLPIVAGGYGPTFEPQSFLDAGIDVVVRGEAEAIVVDLDSALRSGDTASLESIPGILFRCGKRCVATPNREVAPVLDHLPPPARDTLGSALARKSSILVDTARGCRGQCWFCSVKAFGGTVSGPAWRQRRLGAVLDELEMLHARGVRFVKIVDDSLMEPPRDTMWCRALADGIEQRHLAFYFRGSLRAESVNDEVLTQLRRAGFVSFACGIESFAGSALRRMGKSASPQQNWNALECFRRHDVLVQAGLILFDPGTTIDELATNHAALLRADWIITKSVFSEMYAAEGTPFTGCLRSRGTATAGRQGQNLRYRIDDSRVESVRVGVRRWHSAHARLCDKAADPVTSPKALLPDQLHRFRVFSQQLRRWDLDILGGLISAVRGGASDGDISAFVDEQLAMARPRYEALGRQVEDAYAMCGISYDAADNPFG